MNVANCSATEGARVPEVTLLLRQHWLQIQELESEVRVGKSEADVTVWEQGKWQGINATVHEHFKHGLCIQPRSTILGSVKR